MEARLQEMILWIYICASKLEKTQLFSLKNIYAEKLRHDMFIFKVETKYNLHVYVMIQKACS